MPLTAPAKRRRLLLATGHPTACGDSLVSRVLLVAAGHFLGEQVLLDPCSSTLTQTRHRAIRGDHCCSTFPDQKPGPLLVVCPYYFRRPHDD
jgi:hypothetical protein